jgi:hypothetical protein
MALHVAWLVVMLRLHDCPKLAIDLEEAMAPLMLFEMN